MLCCEDCSLMLQQIEMGNIEGQNEYDFLKMQTVIETGCSFCQSLQEKMTLDERGEQSRLTVLWKFQVPPPIVKSQTNPVGNMMHLCFNTKSQLRGGWRKFVHMYKLVPRQAKPGEAGVSIHSLTGYEVPERTSDQTVINLVRQWLGECVHEHTSCYTGRNRHYRPPRLLSLISQDPRLVNGTSCSPGLPWATLSHCWGQNPTFITSTVTNLVQHQKKIPLESLPKTFRDAIKFCRNLDIMYIWIDSLCILQAGEGSQQDWLHHVSEMRQIYWNAHINISADAASSPHDGLFTCRSTTGFGHPICEIKKGPFEGSWSIMVDVSDSAGELGKDYIDSPLAKRGWVLQERVLSPRIVRFGRDQVRWNCATPPYYMSERYPNGFDFGWTNPKFKLLTQYMEKSTPRVGDHEFWEYLFRVTTYTELGLTFATSDKFPAFAAIAEYYSRIYDEEYVAGYLKSHLPLALAWQTRKSILADASSSTQESLYRSPTWSWAKMDGSTMCSLAIPMWRLKDSEEVDAAELVSYRIDLVDPSNKFGQLKYAELILSARLASCSWETSLDEDGQALVKMLDIYEHICQGPVSFDSIAELHSKQDLIKIMVLVCEKNEEENRVHILILRMLKGIHMPTYTRIGAGILESENNERLSDLIHSLPKQEIILI